MIDALCETCGKPTQDTSGRRCNNCWEVEHRLRDYLKSEGGRQYIRNQIPLLDDWVDSQPDAWDYIQVLRDNEATVEYVTQVIDGEGQITNLSPALCGWSFSWRHGSMFIGQTSKTIALKATALFISLWLRGISASFADKLMDGYIIYLERQENRRFSFLATTFKDFCGFQNFRLTREGFCKDVSLGTVEHKIIVALDPQPDEEIIVTFEKRKKQ